MTQHTCTTDASTSLRCNACKEIEDGNLQPFRLALNDPTATVEQICQALRERRDVGEALEWFARDCRAVRFSPYGVLTNQSFDHDGTAPSIIAALIRAQKESK